MKLKVTVQDNQGLHTGTGSWGVDQATNKTAEINDFGGDYNSFENLQRYDLGEGYHTENTRRCDKYPLSGDLPKAWTWLSLASFNGTSVYANQKVDVWEARIGYAILRLAVLSPNTSTPVYQSRNSRDEIVTTYQFINWAPTAPNASYFNVPRVCVIPPVPALYSDACIARDTVIARAKVWVTNKVPYNQGGDYQGYREDCSGYVSMSWESSQPGHVTSTMHEIAHAITKDDLLPGDCLLYAAEHVVLFGGWTNADKTEYQAYEETKPGEGTVTRPTPYPYWYSQSDFIPFRYNEIC